VNHATFPTSRVRIDNNLMYDIDNWKWRSSPAATTQGICGYAIQALWSVEDLMITHNTAFDIRGRQPQFFSYGYGRSEGVIVRKNVLTHHDTGAGALQTASSLNSAGLNPSFTGSVSESWNQYFPYASEFADNLIIPGVRGTTTAANYDSDSPSLNFTKQDCDKYYAGFPGVRCFGAHGEASANARATAAFMNPSTKNLRLRGNDEIDALVSAARIARNDETYVGADIDAIESATGVLRDFTVTVDERSVRMNYFNADGRNCALDYTRDVSGPATRVWDTGEGPRRTVVVEGLAPDTTFLYRLNCPSDYRTGEFRTRVENR
jgi:hypothetical protein